MTAQALFVFKHVGTDTDLAQRKRQAMLGCAPAHKLLELGSIVSVEKQGEVTVPRRFADYKLTEHKDRMPAGVELTRRF